MKTNNLTDTKQRAYPVLDSSSMAGLWVNEPSYNKRSTTSGCLTGNWVEERMLKEAMKNEEMSFAARMKQSQTFTNASEAKEKLNITHSKPVSGAVFTTTQDGRNVGTLDGAPSNKVSMLNIQSSKYILKPDGKYNNPNKTFKTVNQKFQGKVFNPKNTNKLVNTTGHRSKARAMSLIEQAKANVAAAKKAEKKAAAVGSFNSTYTDTNAKSVLNNKVYFPEEQQQKMAQFLEKQMPYYEEEPVTFYTQALKQQLSDETPATTTIYGSKATRGRANFGRNTMFSQPIDEFHRHQVHEYDVDKPMRHPQIELDPEKDDSASDSEDEEPLLYPQDHMNTQNKQTMGATLNRYY